MSVKVKRDFKYRVDPYGTEEVQSSVSDSVCPLLTIDYGDGIQQDQEFTKRNTHGTLDTDISPVADILSVKGNTLAWNQLANKYDLNLSVYVVSLVNGKYVYTVPSVAAQTTSGRWVITPLDDLVSSHKYYRRFRVTKSVGLSCNCSFSICGTLVLEASGGDMSAAVGNYDAILTGSQMASTSGNTPTGYIFLMKYGGVVTIQPGAEFEFEYQVFDLTRLYGAGNEPSSIADFEADYYKWFGSELTFEAVNSGSLRNCKISAIKTTGQDSSWESTKTVPVTSVKGKLGGTGSYVTIFPDGMKSISSTRDEIKQDNGANKAVKRIGSRAYSSGDESDPDVVTDRSTTTYFALSTPEEYILDGQNMAKIMIGDKEVAKQYVGGDVVYSTI